MKNLVEVRNLFPLLAMKNLNWTIWTQIKHLHSLGKIYVPDLLHTSPRQGRVSKYRQMQSMIGDPLSSEQRN